MLHTALEEALVFLQFGTIWCRRSKYGQLYTAPVMITLLHQKRADNFMKLSPTIRSQSQIYLSHFFFSFLCQIPLRLCQRGRCSSAALRQRGAGQQTVQRS